MKRYIIFILAIATSITFYSCKDEDDSPMTGDGGVLTGVWTLLDPSTENPYETETASYGLKIKSDGKIQTVKISNGKISETRDYAIGMIMNFNGNSFDVKGIDKDGKGQFQLDTTIRIVDNKKFVPYLAMRLSSTVFSKEYFSDINIKVDGGYYLKDYDHNSSMSQISAQRDSKLYGDWTLQDQDLKTLYSFSADKMSINDKKMIDWCTNKGYLYVINYIAIDETSQLNLIQSFTYNVSGNTLTLYSSETGKKTFAKGKSVTPDKPVTPDTTITPVTPDTTITPVTPDTTITPVTPDTTVTPVTPITGNPGKLAGAWMRMDETGSYRILTDYGYYGFQINTDGTCQLAEKDIETFTVTTTSETPLFTITSAENGYYTAVTSNGTVFDGTYENGLSLSINDYGSMAYDRLYIKTCSSNIYLDKSQTIVGYYSRVTNADGTSYNYDCTPYEMVGQWNHQYYNEYYDEFNNYHYESGTESFDFDLGGEGTYTDYGSGDSYPVIWACYEENSAQWLYLYYPNQNVSRTYQYFVEDNEFYINVEGNWILFDKN